MITSNVDLSGLEVAASGPADRISENFQLRSTPSLGRNELIGLLGGNSLANLISSGGFASFSRTLRTICCSARKGDICLGVPGVCSRAWSSADLCFHELHFAKVHENL